VVHARTDLIDDRSRLLEREVSLERLVRLRVVSARHGTIDRISALIRDVRSRRVEVSVVERDVAPESRVP